MADESGIEDGFRYEGYPKEWAEALDKAGELIERLAIGRRELSEAENRVMQITTGSQSEMKEVAKIVMQTAGANHVQAIQMKIDGLKAIDIGKLLGRFNTPVGKTVDGIGQHDAVNSGFRFDDWQKPRVLIISGDISEPVWGDWTVSKISPLIVKSAKEQAIDFLAEYVENNNFGIIVVSNSDLEGMDNRNVVTEALKNPVETRKK